MTKNKILKFKHLRLGNKYEIWFFRKRQADLARKAFKALAPDGDTNPKE